MKKFDENSTIRPIDIFPEWKKAINKHLIIWNFPEEKFYEEINAYNFIVASLTKWVNEEIISIWESYFWKETILDAFDFYKDRVSERFRKEIFNLLNN